jgi:hypothetical protein
MHWLEVTLRICAEVVFRLRRVEACLALRVPVVELIVREKWLTILRLLHHVLRNEGSRHCVVVDTHLGALVERLMSHHLIASLGLANSLRMLKSWGRSMVPEVTLVGLMLCTHTS